MSYILFILFCIGISYTISTEMITLPIRSWILKKSQFFGDLVFCPVCTSFWVSVICGIFLTPIFPVIDAFIVLACVKIIEKISNTL